MPKKVNPKPEPAAEADLRNVRPRTAKQLKRWIRDYTGIKIPDKAVCPGHQSPWECFEAIHLKRPSVALILGSRGCGQVVPLGPRHPPDQPLGPRPRDADPGREQGPVGADLPCAPRHRAAPRGQEGGRRRAIAKLRKDGATYANGSEVEILAASPTSVRGPHVPSLKLDEVDEIDTDIRESAMGMCLGRKADRKKKRAEMDASVIMTSTCHRVNGPMARLIEQAEDGDVPALHDVRLRGPRTLPDERSGPKVESGTEVPDCPLMHIASTSPKGSSRRPSGRTGITRSTR